MINVANFIFHSILSVVEEAVPISAPSAAVADSAVPEQHSIIQLVTGSSLVVQLVLVMLVLMSIMTWGIVISKWLSMRQAKMQTAKFSDVFWSSRNLAQITEVSQKLNASPVAKVYAAGHRELTHLVKSHESGSDHSDFADLDNIDRALKRAKTEELTKLEKGTTFLATTASAAPFIGLFGTVWGIMNAFIGLSKVKSSSIQAVAPGISEALIATAIGLAAAIPAAIFYNYFMQQVRVLSRNMDMFSSEFLNIARRHFLK
ncbi:MAG: protein TolQ [Proteobacteria bacterium]|nr:protein TolQ [Pseudomonadota bacterium]